LSVDQSGFVALRSITLVVGGWWLVDRENENAGELRSPAFRITNHQSLATNHDHHFLGS
jgi:hypothetical protein